MSNLYYGVGPVPKGKKRATLEQAQKANQLRYYGEVAVSPIQLQIKKKKELNLVDEQLKLRHFQDLIGVWTKEMKMANLIINDEKSTPSKIKIAKAKKASLIRRKELNDKKIAKQKEIVAKIKAEKNIV